MPKRVALLAAVLCAIPAAAIAGHGKAGLWSVTMHTNMHMAGMSDMPQLTPEQMQQMRAMGMHMPAAGPEGPQSTSYQYCMTPKDVNSDMAPPSMQKDCKVSNMKVQGQTMRADMVCSGRMQGNGHMTVTFDGAEHYTGKFTFKGSSHGRQAEGSNTFEGKWVSADCGSVEP